LHVKLVDAGGGTASDASLALEMGFDAVYVSSGIAAATDPVEMAEAMRYAVIAGRRAYVAGRMPKSLYASARSPLEATSR
jgi:thiazole synthase